MREKMEISTGLLRKDVVGMRHWWQRTGQELGKLEEGLSGLQAIWSGAAASLWYQQYGQELSRLREIWQRLGWQLESVSACSETYAGCLEALEEVMSGGG